MMAISEDILDHPTPPLSTAGSSLSVSLFFFFPFLFFSQNLSPKLEMVNVVFSIIKLHESGIHQSHM